MVIRCSGLTKEFLMHIRGGARVVGFRDLSFDLDDGAFLGVSGPSGIGKSSLLKCVYRTYRPSAGSLEYEARDGRTIDLATAPEEEVLDVRGSEISYVSQFFHVIPRVSARETIAKAMTRRGVDAAEAYETTESMFERVGIDRSLWDLFPSTFSGGEKQRLNVLHALVQRPRLLLLDEPTASLDAKAAAEVVSLLKEIKAEGTAMIGVFHDRDTMRELSDEVLDFADRATTEVPT
ncbi:MAG: phosphonate C-P lyase system protein PhnL [Spirochaetota bacterium]